MDLGRVLEFGSPSLFPSDLVCHFLTLPSLAASVCHHLSFILVSWSLTLFSFLLLVYLHAAAFFFAFCCMRLLPCSRLMRLHARSNYVLFEDTHTHSVCVIQSRWPLCSLSHLLCSFNKTPLALKQFLPALSSSLSILCCALI